MYKRTILSIAVQFALNPSDTNLQIKLSHRMAFARSSLLSIKQIQLMRLFCEIYNNPVKVDG